MDSMFKLNRFVKVISLVLIQTFLVSNVSFAIDTGQVRSHTKQEMLSPSINLDTPQVRLVVQQKIMKDAEGIDNSVSFGDGQVMVEMDFIMRALEISDYKRIVQIFRTSIDPVALVNELIAVSSKTEEQVLTVLDEIDFFMPHVATYRVRNAKEFDPREFEGLLMDVYVNGKA